MLSIELNSPTESRTFVSEIKYFRNRDRREILIMIYFEVALIPTKNAIITPFRTLNRYYQGSLLIIYY
jgi:hypothetical protein